MWELYNAILYTYIYRLITTFVQQEGLNKATHLSLLSCQAASTQSGNMMGFFRFAATFEMKIHKGIVKICNMQQARDKQ